MPLRDDLLEPISSDNPCGTDLQFDESYEQIKLARIEEDDSIRMEAGRTAKKADRAMVIRRAGEMLATRSKNLELAGWYLESLVRTEGFEVLPRGVELLFQLQSRFWETVYPALEDDGSAGIRSGRVEGAFNLLAASIKAARLTRGGVSWLQYQDAKAIGVKTDDMSEEELAAWTKAEEKKQLTGEGLQSSIDDTPKGFYVDTQKSLTEASALLDELDAFQRGKYKEDYPNALKLKASIADVSKVVEGILEKKCETEPGRPASVSDCKAQEAPPDMFAKYDNGPPDRIDQRAPEAPVSTPSGDPPNLSEAAGAPTNEQSAYRRVADAAEFLRIADPSSPVPYLLCSALRLGETRTADLGDATFAVAPSSVTRQTLRRLMNEEKWDALSRLCLSTMAEPCGRVWLDLQRYAWKAATESSNSALAAVIVSTMRCLLTDLPDIRATMMDDDTPSANAETIAWIEAHILPPAAQEPEQTSESEPEPVVFEPVVAPVADQAGVPDIYETALRVLKRGRISDAINMLARDSEQQPSGRMRFHRRVQMAQLCLAADRSSVAYPLLVELSNEMERRGLDTWESAEMLAQPLSLLLRCMEKRKDGAQEREAIFSRLCRLDPQLALSIES